MTMTLEATTLTPPPKPFDEEDCGMKAWFLTLVMCAEGRPMADSGLLLWVKTTPNTCNDARRRYNAASGPEKTKALSQLAAGQIPQLGKNRSPARDESDPPLKALEYLADQFIIKMDSEAHVAARTGEEEVRSAANAAIAADIGGAGLGGGGVRASMFVNRLEQQFDASASHDVSNVDIDRQVIENLLGNSDSTAMRLLSSFTQQLLDQVCENSRRTEARIDLLLNRLSGPSNGAPPVDALVGQK